MQDHGCRKRWERGPWTPWILKISAKNGCFLSFEWEKSNFITFDPPLETVWKNPLMALPGKNPSDAHVQDEGSLTHPASKLSKTSLRLHALYAMFL